MNKKSKIIGAIMLASCQIITTVFASGDICDITKSSDLGKVDIEITTTPNNSVLIQIMPISEALDDLDNVSNLGDSIKYFRNVVADENGKASVSVELDDSGMYKLYAKFNGNEQIDDGADNEFYFATKTEYETLIARLNENITNDDFDGFKTIFLNENDNGIDNTKVMGFPSDEAIDYDIVAQLFYNTVKATTLDTDGRKNSALASACVGIEALKENKTDNAYSFLEEYLNISADFNKFSSRHIKSVNSEKKFSQVLKKEINSLTLTNISDTDKAVKTALILTTVNYPENSGLNIKEVMTAYSDILSENGLTSLSDNTRVYDLLKGKNLDSISNLITEYKTALSQANSQGGGAGGSGGGGGSSSGGGNSSGIVTGSPVTIVDDGNAPSQSGGEKIDLNFEDLDGVDWAYSAISRLYEKKIISGYSENQFKPLNKVKREEFVKMLVCAMGLEDETATNPFADVAGDWSEKYVAIAFNNNMVNGISDGVFGRGREISRQDMSLMIYNALVKSGYQAKGYTYSFDDEAAEYAKTAIAELSGIGIVSGVGDNKFNPFVNSTRAEAAVIIDRIVNYLNKGE